MDRPAGQDSLYIPRHHLIEDREFLQDFMDEFPFVELVTCSPEIRVSHIPVMLDRTRGRYGTLYGHVSRQNPQAEAFNRNHPAVIVFRGPHAYISPTCYENPEAVPTWNFAAVHATGKLRAVTEAGALRDFLAKLVRKFEGEDSPYVLTGLPQTYLQQMIAGIIGFEMEIERLKGKFKLGQERSEADRTGILRYVQSANAERSLHDLTASLYKQMPRGAAPK